MRTLPKEGKGVSARRCIETGLERKGGFQKKKKGEARSFESQTPLLLKSRICEPGTDAENAHRRSKGNMAKHGIEQNGFALSESLTKRIVRSR